MAYVDFAVFDIVYLIYAYPKGEKDNLTKAERNELKKMIDRLEEALAKARCQNERL